MRQPLPYRYPGAKPFTRDPRELFFGRGKAISELFNLIMLEPLTILYSKSGMGKSSLLNAGVIPKFTAENTYEALTVRFNAWVEGKEDTPVQITRDLLLHGFARESSLNRIFPDDKSLWYAAKTRQLNGLKKRNKGSGILLVFDQFEELFTYPDQEVQQFGRQFGELLQTGVPQRVRKMAELFAVAQPDLLSPEEEDAIEQRMNIRIVCAVRSDRMSLLDALKSTVPQILSTRYELQPLNETETREAIVSPSEAPGEYMSPTFTYEPEAVHLITNFLTRGGPVESFQLQILCQSVEQHVIDTGDNYIEAREIGDPELIFETYYDNQIGRISDPIEQLAARKLIEAGLVYEKEQRRLQLYEGQIRDDFQISDVLLRKLVDTHLLRAEPGPRGGYYYELSHDTLVGPVLKAKAKRADLEKAAVAAEQQRLQKEALEQERLKSRRAWQTAVLGLILAAVSTGAFIYGLWQRRKAVAEKEKAEYALSQFKAEQAQRNRLEIEKLIGNADVYANAGAMDLAIKELEKGLVYDTLNVRLIQLLEKYKRQSGSQ